MEIKVISSLNDQNIRSKLNCKVTIVEGFEITYSFIQFDSREDFNRKISRNKKRKGKFIGILTNLACTSLPDVSGWYLYIEYVKDDTSYYLIVQQSEVYITNNGQTIDKVIVN
ncbi:MAG TPA: hypothetical protein VGB37_12660 [Candidatus Lokiarchaeia archaeon]